MAEDVPPTAENPANKKQNKSTANAPETPASVNYAQGVKPEDDPFKVLGERLLKFINEIKPNTDPDF